MRANLPQHLRLGGVAVAGEGRVSASETFRHLPLSFDSVLRWRKLLNSRGSRLASGGGCTSGCLTTRSSLLNAVREKDFLHGVIEGSMEAHLNTRVTSKELIAGAIVAGLLLTM